MLLYAAFALLIMPTVSRGEIPSTFSVELSISLCGEAKFEGIALDIYYSVGTDPALLPATVTAQTINQEANTGTFTIQLPSYYGTTVFHIVSFCRNAFGFSVASNTQDVSNCDALAVIDTDGDGVANNVEDRNCDGFYSPGDLSNPDNVDTDGDGVRDLVEVLTGYDPSNPGSSPLPMIYASAPFDPDGNGDSNPTVWRPSAGMWFIKDYQSAGNTLAISLGAPGDIPFVYDSDGSASNVGVIRESGTQYTWIFNGSGFSRSNNTFETAIPFGIFGDNVIPGPWEHPGITNPAVARLFNDTWSFYIYQSDGTVRFENFGRNGDMPMVQDYDGDGLFDIAVFRPSASKLYIRRSTDNVTVHYDFGTGTSDDTVRGDYTGDGIDDISFWEPQTTMFYALTSDNGFDDEQGAMENPDFYFAMQLGQYATTVPLSWNVQHHRMVYTVVDHNTGIRSYRLDNNPSAAVTTVQWGLAGDSHL